VFGKTREKLEAKYVKPVQNGMAAVAIVAVLALFVALIALGKVL
jgi:hypothetical protein